MIASRSKSERGLDAIAGRAVDAAVGAGAGDAEAFVQDSTGLQVRIFDQRVESLTEAGERGLGVRVWIDGRAGYAYGTDLGDRGIGEIAAGAVEAGAWPTPTSSPPRRRRSAIPRGSRASPTPRRPTGRPSARSTSRSRPSAPRARPTGAWRRSRPRCSSTSAPRWRSPPPAASPAPMRRPATPTSRRSPSRRRSPDRPRVRHGSLPAALDPRAIGREAAERSTVLLGAAKPASRTCPVVLDETVAASFAGFIGGVLCADAVQRGRSPFARRLGEAVGSAALTLADDGADPARSQLRTVRRRGHAHRGHDADRSRRAEGIPARLLHGPPRGRRRALDRQRRARGLSLAAGSVDLNLIVATGELGFDELLGEAGDGMYVTDVAGLHSGVNPVSGTFSVGATGRAISGGELAEPADEFTIASDLSSMLAAVRATGSEALGPVRRLGLDPGAADRRDGDRRRVMAPEPSGSVDRPSAAELKERLEAERRGLPFWSTATVASRSSRASIRSASGSRSGVGATSTCVSTDRGVRVHAELHRTGGEWTVLDDDLSHNGTFVNGERIRGRRRLRDLDQLRLGKTALTFREPGGARPDDATATAADARGSIASPTPAPGTDRALSSL